MENNRKDIQIIIIIKLNAHLETIFVVGIYGYDMQEKSASPKMVQIKTQLRAKITEIH